jgi:hypothetical protein
MSVAWAQKTVKELGQAGSTEIADPYTESGERRTSVVIAAAGSCKTPMREFKSHRRLLKSSKQPSEISHQLRYLC